MNQVTEMTRFGEKAPLGMQIQREAQDFKGNVCVELDVLAQIHISEDPFPNQAE
jgi:hypothetical protein